MQIISEVDWLKALDDVTKNRPFFGMYSTLWGGVVKNPRQMMIPLDDHMVHRGDGIFEAIRVVNKKPYLLMPHLDRLVASAAAIAMKLPMPVGKIDEICRAMCELVETPQGILRLFVSRGPGDFSPDPYATIGSQFHAIVMVFKPYADEKYEKGVSAMFSKIPVKPSPYATIKSCNYLQNVMMKKECIDAGFDYSIGVNGNEKIAEGPTENLLVLDTKGRLCAPKFDYTLRGTTLIRVMELAEKLRQSGEVKDIVVCDMVAKDFANAKEAMMVGTAIGVLPVTRLGSAPIGDGKVGSVAKGLYQLFLQDLPV